MKKMHKKTKIIITIFSITLILLLLFYFTKNITSEETKKINQTENNHTNHNQPQTEQSTNTEKNATKEINTQSQNGESSSSSANQEENPSIQNSQCTIKQISYSMINPNKTYICNQKENEICINKTIICSIEIHNRDSNINGTFNINLLFKEENEIEDLHVKNFNFNLEPMTYKRIEENITIISTKENQIANKDINCLYTTLETPKKQIC